MATEISWPGFYIVFEGNNKCGKTTQVIKLAETLRKKYVDREVVVTREPGGTNIANAIRHLAQVEEFEGRMTIECEAYLYAASRAQTLREIVKPSLLGGNIVIADRSYLSSLVFQGWAGELGIEKVMSINQVAVDEVRPDLPIFLDVELKTILSRNPDVSGDKHERKNRDFYEQVYQGYMELLAISELGLVRVDGHGSVDEVAGRVNQVVLESLHDRSGF